MPKLIWEKKSNMKDEIQDSLLNIENSSGNNLINIAEL